MYAFGSHQALVRADTRHDAQVRTRPALAGVHTLYSLYIASTCTKHRYERLAEALQLYSALQRSTSLQLYILYSIHPSTAPLRYRGQAMWMKPKIIPRKHQEKYMTLMDDEGNWVISSDVRYAAARKECAHT